MPARRSRLHTRNGGSRPSSLGGSRVERRWLDGPSGPCGTPIGGFRFGSPVDWSSPRYRRSVRAGAVNGWRVAALVLLATLLAQAAWILAVPPFRGMDEFDHAFRAAGVASGQWRL